LLKAPSDVVEAALTRGRPGDEADASA